MPFVELFAPQGALDGDRGRRVKERLVAEVMLAEGAPDSAAAREISWLVLNEPQAWFVGGKEVGDDERPRFVVRVSVPAGSLDDAKRADMIQRITRVLAEAEEEPRRLYDRPVAWVHLIEIPDGNWGAMGRVFRLPDIIEFASDAAVTA
ncbi:tautomerase family protein [Nonomuraea africana]|uniref:Phenylpyruvate tautomerase PptA (4-oxalocrotonate tautomerase family) n=1 Tax=Nonomuraea africana TaxID=46171 RepID=A0ABR9KEV0_9ACTN|nr:tautomerase family protein [Nonomuraea africana]MBE1560188.1 phenylpyruvate tautomerase PptA (4-oxalocrotonate tautomerase family) [Nonomuraea africana]